MPTQKTEREVFESNWVGKSADFRLDSDGEYTCDDSQYAWQLWQEARAPLLSTIAQQGDPFAYAYWFGGKVAGDYGVAFTKAEADAIFNRCFSANDSKGGRSPIDDARLIPLYTTPQSEALETAKDVIENLLNSADCEWENKNQGHDWADAVSRARSFLDGDAALISQKVEG